MKQNNRMSLVYSEMVVVVFVSAMIVAAVADEMMMEAQLAELY